MENNPVDAPLEEKCPKCAGNNKIKNQPCPLCDGKGVVLTEAGKLLLKYLQDSIRLSEH